MPEDLVIIDGLELQCPYCGRSSFHTNQALREHKNRCAKSRSTFKRDKEIRYL